MELKHQAALSEEHLGQVQGVKDEHHDLKLQLKKLTVRKRLQVHANCTLCHQEVMYGYIFQSLGIIGQLSKAPH